MKPNFDQISLFLSANGVKYKKDRHLLIEAYRRKTYLNAEDTFLGLGTPSEYKSNYFKPSFGTEIKRCLNWYTVNDIGEELLKKIISRFNPSIKKDEMDKENEQLFDPTNAQLQYSKGYY